MTIKRESLDAVESAVQGWRGMPGGKTDGDEKE